MIKWKEKVFIPIIMIIREIGDYYNGNAIGKHVMLTKDGEVEINNY